MFEGNKYELIEIILSIDFNDLTVICMSSLLALLRERICCLTNDRYFCRIVHEAWHNIKVGDIIKLESNHHVTVSSSHISQFFFNWVL